jgi:hypothetical protein
MGGVLRRNARRALVRGHHLGVMQVPGELGVDLRRGVAAAAMLADTLSAGAADSVRTSGQV